MRDTIRDAAYKAADRIMQQHALSLDDYYRAPWDRDTVAEIIDAIFIEMENNNSDDFASTIERELTTDRMDASRYRWLRDKCKDVDIKAGLGWLAVGKGNIDDGVDDAMQQEA